MGLTAIEIVCRELIRHGMAENCPAALVEDGTLPGQRVVVGTLADLAERVKTAAVSGTSLIIVGEVVKLHEKLRWFEG
jgi:uroporphyrin-III C-methyltransferase/precorrin-2 dehydrogenase/sirohydrochlorin ferrochelatase